MTRKWLACLIGIVVAASLSACGGSATSTPAPTTVSGGSSRLDGLVDVHSIHYRSFDGSIVPALIAIPRASTIRGCLIWQFGLGSRKEDSSVVWQGAAQLGLATFSIDLRDHGARARSPDQLINALQSPSQISEVITGTVGDLRRGIDYLEAQPYCRHNVAYAGVSLGGIIGTLLAASDQRVRALIIASTPATLATAVSSNIILTGIKHEPQLLGSALRSLSVLDPRRFIGGIAPRPVLILSGLHDAVVPPASARALQAAARHTRTIINYDGGHDPLSGPAAVANAQAISSFLLSKVVEPTYGITGQANGTYWQPVVS